MNCYIHSDQPAVGLCRACFRAVCPGCRQVEAGVTSCACCRDRVAAIARIEDVGPEIYRTVSRSQQLSARWYKGTGVALFILSALSMAFPKNEAARLAAMPGLFVAVCLFMAGRWATGLAKSYGRGAAPVRRPLEGSSSTHAQGRDIEPRP
jgi:hypothetical protein